jgi:hypothetical protein
MIRHFVPKIVEMLFRRSLRKRMLSLAKLPIIALGLVGLLLTTDILDILKEVWSVSETAAIALEQATHIK